MFAMTIGAHGRIAHTGLDRHAVYAFAELAGDLLVTLAARIHDLPMIDPGIRIAAGTNVVRSVATVATGGVLVSCEDGTAVDALFVRFDGTCDGDLVTGEESGIAVTLGASGGKVAERDGGIRFGRRFCSVNRAVAGSAFRRVGIAVFGGLAVNAFGERLDLVGVTLVALGGHEFLGGGEIVDVAMTGGAGGLAESGVRALFEVFHFLIMASGALDLRNFLGVREFLDRGVAILATENAVSAGSVFRGVDGNIFAGLGFHTRLAVASEAILVRSRDRCRPGQEQGGSQCGEHRNTFLSVSERSTL